MIPGMLGKGAPWSGPLGSGSAFRGLVSCGVSELLRGVVRSGKLGLGVSWDGTALSGPVRSACVEHCEVSLSRVELGLSSSGVVVQASAARAAAACATFRHGPSWLALARSCPVSCRNARHGVSWGAMPRPGLVLLGLVSHATLRLGFSWTGELRLGGLGHRGLRHCKPRSGFSWPALRCRGLAGFASVRSFMGWLCEPMQGMVWWSKLLSGQALRAWAKLAKLCHGPEWSRRARRLLVGLPVVRWRRVRSGDVSHGVVSLGVSRRAPAWHALLSFCGVGLGQVKRGMAFHGLVRSATLGGALWSGVCSGMVS
jgi:hypothetical protein